MRYTKAKLCLTLCLAIGCFESQALQKSKSFKQDSRIRYVTYDQHQVYDLNLISGVATNLVLAKGEKFKKFYTGRDASFSIAATDNNVMIKTVTDDHINTNLVIMTNKRTYYFQVTNTKKQTIFAMKFTYPNEVRKKNEQAKRKKELESVTNPATAPIVYLDYLGVGDKSLKPLKMFGSKTHTFLKFSEESRVPAVFRASKINGTEQLVNSKFKDGWLIIYSAEKHLTLRLGDKSLCIKRMDSKDKGNQK